jgi:hypothetical protein
MELAKPASTGLSKRRRPLRLMALSVAVVALLFLAEKAYVYISGGFLSSHEKQVHAALKQSLHKQSKRIDLREIASFRWSKVCFFPPYADRTLVERKLGFAWNGYDDVAWWDHDGFWTLLFVQDHEVIPIRIPRVDIGDFSTNDAYWQPCISPEDAILTVTDLEGSPRRFSVSRQ